MLMWSAWTGPPALACKLALAGTPAQPRFAPLQEKNIRHGGLEDPGQIIDQIKRTVNLNFGKTQPIKDYSPHKFGHFTCFGNRIHSSYIFQFGHLFSVI